VGAEGCVRGGVLVMRVRGGGCGGKVGAKGRNACRVRGVCGNPNPLSPSQDPVNCLDK